MEQKNKLIPELRFPEFVKDGEWEEKMLGEIANVVASGDLDNESYSSVQTEQHQYPIFSNSIAKEGLYGYNSYFKYNKSSVTITARGTLGVAFVRNSEFVGIGRLLVVSNFKNINPIFLKENWNYKAKIPLENGGIPQLTALKAKLVELLFPKTETEQQKIADCLSSLDEVITAHNDKLETLKNHKKGLLQNLFPDSSTSSGGQTTPNYRFPEFVNDGEWIFEEFSKVYKFLVTNSYSRDNLNYENGDVKNIHYGDIHTKFSTLFDITKEEVPYLNLDIPISKIRQECYCKEGDVIFADASEDVIDIGKSIEVVNLNGEKLVSGLHTLLARQIEQKLVVGFAGYLFLTSEIRKQIQKESQGAKVLGISGTRLSNIKIYYPKNPKEQQKIADCLMAVDDLITAQTEKIEQLKTHKKGLMQGLFP